VRDARYRNSVSLRRSVATQNNLADFAIALCCVAVDDLSDAGQLVAVVAEAAEPSAAPNGEVDNGIGGLNLLWSLNRHRHSVARRNVSFERFSIQNDAENRGKCQQ